MKSQRLQSNSGVALGMALSAIVIIGVLIGGVLFMVTQDHRIAGNAVRQARAAAAAEMGLSRIPQDWVPTDHARLAAGDTLQRYYTTSGGGSAQVVMTRLPGPFYWAVSEGSAGRGSESIGRRRYGALFRIDMPDMNILGAITTQGKLIVTGNAQVNGNDAAPTGWTGCGIGAGVAGVAMADQTKLDTKGACSTKGCVDGSPKYLQTPEAGDTATYFVYGNMTYASLAAMAQVKFVGDQNLSNILPVLSGGTCATSVNKNWGDNLRATPAGACERYFPIIHVAGNLQVSQGRGQGILLVDGDVHVTGNFEFAGAIIARGTVTATGTGAKVTGGVLAAAVNWGDESALLGNTAIQYSSCAMEAALSAMAYPKQAKERGWTNLY